MQNNLNSSTVRKGDKMLNLALNNNKNELNSNSNNNQNKKVRESEKQGESIKIQNQNEKIVDIQKKEYIKFFFDQQIQDSIKIIQNKLSSSEGERITTKNSNQYQWQQSGNQNEIPSINIYDVGEYKTDLNENIQDSYNIIIEQLQNNKKFKKIQTDEFIACLNQLYKRGYKIEKFIKAGGFGFVFEGIIQGRKVAIKLSKIEYDNNTNTQKKINTIQFAYEKEMKIYNEIKSFHYIVNKELCFIVGEIIIEIMELCKNDLLYEINKRAQTQKQFTEQEVVNYMFQLINALVEIHINGIFHSDIKPENILLSENDEIKLTDFGISQLIDIGIDHQNIAGTLSFCSPEQLKCMGMGIDENGIITQQWENLKQTTTIDEKSDIYSMGLTFLLLLGIDKEDFKNVRLEKWGLIKKKIIQINNKFINLFSFVQHFMLNKKPELRKKSFQLAFDLHFYLGMQVDFSNENQRISQLISEYENNLENESKNNENHDNQIKNQQNKQENNTKDKENKSKKYLAFLYCFKGKIDESIEYFQKCIDLSSKIQWLSQTDDILYFENLYANLLLKNKDFYKGFEKLSEIHQKNEQIQMNDSQYADLLDSLAYSYEITGDYKEAKKYFEELLQIRNKLYNMEHPQIADTLNSLSTIYQKLGDSVNALKYNQAALEMRQFFYSEEHIELAQSYMNFALIYYSNGDYLKSIENLNKALKIRTNFFKKDHSLIASTHQSLAKSYSMLQYPQSLEQDLLALQMRERIYKNEIHFDLVDSYNSMSIGLAKIGKCEESLEYAKKGLKMSEQLYQEDSHPLVSNLCQSLAGQLTYLGENQEALKLFKRSLQIREKLLEQDHFSTAQSYYWIGIMHSKLGNPQEEKVYYKKSIKIREKCFQQKQNSWMAQSLSSMAGFNSRQGNYEKALKYDKQAFKMRQFLFKQDHQDLAESFNSIGITYFMLEDHELGIENMMKALEMRQNLFKFDHHRIADSKNELAIVYQILGQDVESLKLSLEALNMRIACYKTRDHQDIIHSYFLLAIQYANLNDNKNSEHFELLALQMYERLKKEYPPYITEFSFALSNTRQGNYEKTLENLKCLLPIKQGIWY